MNILGLLKCRLQNDTRSEVNNTVLGTLRSRLSLWSSLVIIAPVVAQISRIGIVGFVKEVICYR